MSDETGRPTCTAGDCDRPADGYLCHRCGQILEKILAELPATLTDLQTTLTRQARTSRSGGGKPTKAAASPLPFDVHASELADRARNGLSTWIRHLVESRGVEVIEGPTHPPGGCQHDSCRIIRNRAPVIERTEDMALWLVQYIETIRQDEVAADLLTQLQGIQSELRAAVDNREAKFAGQCTAILSESELAVTVAGTEAGALTVAVEQSPPVERICGATLRMRPNSKTVTCKACGAEYPTLEISRRILMQSQDYQGTATFIANALTDAGYPVKAETIRKWAQRSRDAELRPVGPTHPHPACRHSSCRTIRDWQPTLEKHPIVSWRDDELGRPEYRIGDVWDRVKAGRDTARTERISA